MKGRNKNLQRKRTLLLNKLQKLLTGRGITNIKYTSGKIQKISFLSMIRKSDIGSNIKSVINDLGINMNANMLIVKRTVKFDEDVSSGPLAKYFPGRQKTQHFTLYNYIPNRKHTKTRSPIVIFSHGGAIRKNTSLKSPFLSIIEQYAEKNGKNLMFVTLDHRGSNSHEEKKKYSLEDRVADFEIATYVSLILLDEFVKHDILWDGGIIFMGNSMGGHVATMVASEFHPNILILPQPAAYSVDAQKLPFGNKFTKAITKNGSWKTSPAFDALEKFLQKGGKALIIRADDDEKVPIEIIKRYAKELAYNYSRHILRNPLKSKFVHIPGSHTTIHPKEVKILKKSLIK